MIFKSQICTTRSQSETLLKLGLKKETADMGLTLIGENEWIPFMKGDYIHEDDIPAWSLHRLIEMMGANIIQHWLGLNVERDFDLIIDTIEELIKEGYFNKEYLEE